MTEPRIVSLVPSLTELVCDLGLADRLVGRTGFCIHPTETVRHIPKVGGTKDLRMDVIRALAPTHVIVNVEENRREDAETLAQFVPEVIVTDVRDPAQNPALYRQLGAEFDRVAEAEALCAAFLQAAAALVAPLTDPGAHLSRPHRPTQAPLRPRETVVYLIWRDPWMTISADTYIARSLALIGWDQMPVPGVERYPQVDLAGLGPVDRVLLSSEPFHFKERHVEEVAALRPEAQVSLVDGEMCSWYGSRAISAMAYLGSLASLAP